MARDCLDVFSVVSLCVFGPAALLKLSGIISRCFQVFWNKSKIGNGGPWVISGVGISYFATFCIGAGQIK